MSSPWFLPARSEDLTRSAKILAFHLQLKLQQAQELLSRLYGYADLHELQQAMKADRPPGPYDDLDGCDADRFQRRQQHILNVLRSFGPDRPGRPLKEITAEPQPNHYPGTVKFHTYGPDLGVSELDLFYSPAHQRPLAKVVREADGLMDPNHRFNPAFAYGTLAHRATTGHRLIRLTALGAAVRMALSSGFYEDLSESHPNCPWAQLAHLEDASIAVNLSFDDYSDMDDVHNAFDTLAPLATDVVDLFEQIAGRETEGLAHPDSVCGRFYDCKGYSKALYTAGYVFFCSGDYERASNYLERYWRFSAYHSYDDTRSMIAVSNLHMNDSIPLGVVFAGNGSDDEVYLSVELDAIRDGSRLYHRYLFPDEDVLLPFVCDRILAADVVIAAWAFAQLACSNPPFIYSFPHAYSQSSFSREEAMYAHMKPFFEAHPAIAKTIARLCQREDFQEHVHNGDHAGAEAMAKGPFSIVIG